jgi:hypothetical protein
VGRGRNQVIVRWILYDYVGIQDDLQDPDYLRVMVDPGQGSTPPHFATWLLSISLFQRVEIPFTLGGLYAPA